MANRSLVSVGETDGGGGNSGSDNEFTPLKIVKKHPGIDVDKFLESLLKVRMPTKSHEDQWVVANPQRKEASTVHKAKVSTFSQANDCEKAIATCQVFFASGKEHAQQSLRACPELPQSLPPVAEMKATARKYRVDLITNGVYVAVSIVMAVFGGMSGALASSEWNLQQNRNLGYWVIFGGIVSSIICLTKNVRTIVAYIMMDMDTVADKVHSGIDKLQTEIDVDVREHLSEITQPQAGDNAESEVLIPEKKTERLAQQAAIKSLIKTITFGVTDAQAQLKEPAVPGIKQVLPSAVKERSYCLGAFAAPWMVIIVLKFLVDLLVSVASWNRAEEELKSKVVPKLSDMSLLGVMIITFLLNVLMAWTSSEHMMRYFSNTTMRKIEQMINAYLTRTVKASIPGGAPGMQHSLDVLVDPASALSGGRDCTANCTGGGCTIS